MASKVKRLVTVAEETDRSVKELAEQIGMTADDFYAYLAERFFELPTSVLKTQFTDVYRKMNIR